MYTCVFRYIYIFFAGVFSEGGFAKHLPRAPELTVLEIRDPWRRAVTSLDCGGGEE
jgi:hypothetical protein